MTPNELSDRLWGFAARVAKVVDALPDTRTGKHVAGQLIRCGTSAPPNYDEGRVAESRADFAHKVNVALKELVETEGWLKFIEIAGLLTARRLGDLQDECSQALPHPQFLRCHGKGPGQECKMKNAQSSMLNELAVH